MGAGHAVFTASDTSSGGERAQQRLGLVRLVMNRLALCSPPLLPAFVMTGSVGFFHARRFCLIVVADLGHTSIIWPTRKVKRSSMPRILPSSDLVATKIGLLTLSLISATGLSSLLRDRTGSSERKWLYNIQLMAGSLGILEWFM